MPIVVFLGSVVVFTAFASTNMFFASQHTKGMFGIATSLWHCYTANREDPPDVERSEMLFCALHVLEET